MQGFVLSGFTFFKEVFLFVFCKTIAAKFNKSRRINADGKKIPCDLLLNSNSYTTCELCMNSRAKQVLQLN